MPRVKHRSLSTERTTQIIKVEIPQNTSPTVSHVTTRRFAMQGNPRWSEGIKGVSVREQASRSYKELV